MSHIQPSHGPVTDNTCLTDGGNRTLINGNELLVDDACTSMLCVYSPLGEDDSHVMGIYREHSAGMEM
jgi:hypothetical protein